ncbi:Hypothetical protein HDN1F_16710 [gamma proteobacterium HdN1]|nr:Hypothetical protein HDN1F_16710 [gamma proteobacterium HdN1]
MSMSIDWFTGFAALLAVLALFFGLRYLLKPNWFRGWVQGNLGIILLALAVALGLLVYNTSQYHALDPNLPVAVISITEQKPQHYEMRVTSGGGEEIIRTIEGDRWMLTLSAIRWSGIPAMLGARTSIRLDELQARFYDPERLVIQDRVIRPLSEPDLLFDNSKHLRAIATVLRWLHPERHTTIAAPFADGAIFSVLLTPDGLDVRPVNERATLVLAK